VFFLLTSFLFIIVVGGTLDKSCQLEGMMESVISKEQELQKALDEIKLLRGGLRNEIEMEQQQTPEHPVICAPKVLLEEDSLVSDENDLLAISEHPTIPPKMSLSESSSAGGLRLSQSTDSTFVKVGDRAYTTQHLPSSPAHSCPMPTYVDPRKRPFMGGLLTDLPSCQVYNDEDFFGFSFGIDPGTLTRISTYTDDQWSYWLDRIDRKWTGRVSTKCNVMNTRIANNGRE
jgi:hypothetical protein